ncbi:MAG: electron transport complex protein RnfG [Gammaproteobacteria bacterium]|jgi:electron transport complex protein RnfG
MAARTRLVPVVRAAVTLLLLAGISAALLRGLELVSAERVAHNEDVDRERQIARVLDGIRYDNAPGRDVVRIDYVRATSAIHRAYRVRDGKQYVGVVLEITSTQGYNGSIRFLLCIESHGAVRGVAFLRHRETPGLGDRLEAGNSPWLQQFFGAALRPVPMIDEAPDAMSPDATAAGVLVDAEGWRVRRDGGAFDAYTGATVTSRAVIGAVASGLAFYARRHRDIFTVPVNTVLRDAP